MLSVSLNISDALILEENYQNKTELQLNVCFTVIFNTVKTFYRFYLHRY